MHFFLHSEEWYSVILLAMDFPSMQWGQHQQRALKNKNKESKKVVKKGSVDAKQQ